MDEDLCEICFAREAAGSEDVDDVETRVCDFCSASPVELVGDEWKHTNRSFLNP